MPIWNQVLTIQKVCFCSRERFIVSPPVFVIEVYDRDFGGKTELMGRMQIQPLVEDNQDYKFAPQLQWYDIYKGIECTGQLLMSAQVLQIPETVIKSTMYDGPSEAYVSACECATTDYIEPLPANLIPKTTSYKLDIYWWGLRDVAITKKPCVVLEIDELKIKSDIILEKKTNCNFPNGKSTHSFEAPLKQIYCPPMSVKLYDSSTFGRTVFLGTNVVKNPNKYLVNWLPKAEREASLHTASIMSSNFSKVNHVTYMVNTINTNSESENSMSEELLTKRHSFNLMNLFGAKMKREEEYTLLSVLKKNHVQKNTNDDDYIKYGIKPRPEEQVKDWWLRFFCSQKECIGEDKLNPADHIMVKCTFLNAMTVLLAIFYIAP